MFEENEETIKKRDELIKHFGSVEKYQAGIFNKIPRIFLMTCDEHGHVQYDRESMGKYLQKEMKEHSLTIDELIDREKKVFSKIINDYHFEVFSKLKMVNDILKIVIVKE